MHWQTLFSLKEANVGCVAEHKTTVVSQNCERKFTAKLKSSVHLTGNACTSSNIIMLLHNRRKIYEVYLLGALGGGFIEYVLSFLAEKILGAVFWDYSKLPLNINGRTTIPIMLFWGLLCVAVVFGIYRPLDKLLKKIPPKTALIIAIIMTVIIVFDLSLVMLAVFRYGRRAAGVEAMTLIGRFADGVFNDSFMALRFPTVKF